MAALESPVTRLAWHDRVFLAMVAVLPVHTVFLSAWISWKPFLVLLAIVVLADVTTAVVERRWPYHRAVSVALVPFAAVVAVGLPEPALRDRFARLALALVVGAFVMLATERRLRSGRLREPVLRTVFWSAAAMGLTGIVLSVVAVGGFGEAVLAAVDDLPGVFRVYKAAYLETGFLALTNWHQDPGYGAAWAVLWSMIALVASTRGLGSRWRLLDAAVIGSVWLNVVMTFSRTGWLSLAPAVAITVVALRREGHPLGATLRKVGAAALTTVVLLGGVWLVDAPGVGGDLDRQFAFRIGQAVVLMAEVTGWFTTSEEFAAQFAASEERVDVWPEYLEMFRASPLLGVGLSVGWQTHSTGQEPHNLFLQLLAETGLLGLAAFFGLLAVVVGTGRGGPVAAGLLLVSFLPSITQTVLFEPTWWFAAGLYLGGIDRPAGDTAPVDASRFPLESEAVAADGVGWSTPPSEPGP